jgi:GT2 family glycosyltransferase
MAASDGGGVTGRIGVVIATRDRASRLDVTLERLLELPERPAIVLVDNSSRDGTPSRVRARFPAVDVVALARNEGAGARTAGVERLDVPYVAFSDDDSWWSPGALERAAAYFDRHPRLGLIAGRILVGEQGRLDPTCAEMARSPLPSTPGLPGRAVMGFVACGAIVRRRAYLEVGGFEPRLGVGGEEDLLALDLASAGWKLAYVDDVVAHHEPVGRSDRAARMRTATRNDLWTSWMRRPASSAVRHTARVVLGVGSDRARALGVVDAFAGLPWAIGKRRAVPWDIEARLRTVERSRGVARFP